MSIKRKIFLGITLLVVIPAFIFGYFSNSFLRKKMEAEIIERYETEADYVESGIYLFLQICKTQTQDFSSDEALKGKVKNILKADDSKKILLQEDLKNYLYNSKMLIDIDSDLHRIDIVSPDGKLIGSSRQIEKEIDFSKKDFFKRGLYEVNMGDIIQEPERNLIPFAAPIFNNFKEKKIVAVLINYFSLRNFFLAQQGQISKRYGAFLPPRQRPGSSYEVISDRGKNISESSRMPNDKDYMDDEFVKQCAVNNKELSKRWRDSYGREVLGNSMCLDFKDFRWIMLTKHNISQEVTEVNRLFYIFILFATLAFFLFSSYLNYLFVNPLKNLEKQAAQLTHGDFNAQFITAKKRDDEIGSLAKSLGRMLLQIQRRSRELKSKQAELLKYVWALKKSNDELDSFAYIASHDLKEPIRGIHNHAEVILEDCTGKILDEPAVKRIKRICDLSMHMENLIDSLLHFSGLGRVDLSFKNVDMNEMIESIRVSLLESIEKQGARVLVPRKLPTIYCDSIRLKEVFRNLITNAIKYNEKSDKIVEISYKEDEISKDHIFLIKDNGIGVPSSHFETIFKVFKRLHSVDKYGGGTGMGLTIVKKIVEKHNGKVWVESVLGEGTTFYVQIPIKERLNKILATNE